MCRFHTLRRLGARSTRNAHGQHCRVVLDNLAAANLPGRAKKVLDQAKTPPFPEGEPSKLVPGGRRASYATVFGFTHVAELRRQWEEDVKRKLEPFAKSQS